MSKKLIFSLLLSSLAQAGKPGKASTYTIDDFEAEFPARESIQALLTKTGLDAQPLDIESEITDKIGSNLYGKKRTNSQAQVPSHLLGINSQYLIEEMLRLVPAAIKNKMLTDNFLSADEMNHIYQLYQKAVAGEVIDEDAELTTPAAARNKDAHLYPTNLPELDISTLPTQHNWMHLSTGVKNQGMCGSCWAISAISVIEAYYKKFSGKVENLSTQQVLDCMHDHLPLNSVAAAAASPSTVLVGLSFHDDPVEKKNQREQQKKDWDNYLVNEKNLIQKRQNKLKGGHQNGDSLPDLDPEEIRNIIRSPRKPKPYGGCQGGAITWPYHVLSKMRGVVSGHFYQYRSFFGEDFANQCLLDDDFRFKPLSNARKSLKPEAKVTGMKLLPSNSYEYAMDHLTYVGPLHVVVDASMWNLYDQGIFDGCPNGRSLFDEKVSLNHAVVLEGYGTDAATGRDYWLVKNSWGSSWGENGYIRLPRYKKNDVNFCTRTTEIIHGTSGNNYTPYKVERDLCGPCGILYMLVYPVIAKAPEAVVLPSTNEHRDVKYNVPYGSVDPNIADYF